MTSQQRTIIALLGNTVVRHALTLLLKGEGYETRILQESLTDLADGLQDGVDVLLLTPGLNNRVRDVSPERRDGDPKMAAMPVLTLSTALRETLSDRTGMVLWPPHLEDLRRAI